MVIKAILVALVAALGKLDLRILGMTMISRPIIMGTLVGVIFGDVKQGMIIGAQIELLSMGVVGIGAHSAPPDVTLGSALCTAFALQSGTGAEVALTLALPISVFATSIAYLTHIPLNHALGEKAKKKAAEGDYKAMERCQWLGLFNYGFFPFLIVFFGMLLGAPVFEYLIKVIPSFIIDGMGVAAGILPALGFALLMKLTYTKELAPFLFIGFVLVAFLNMSNVGVAIVGAIIAILVWTNQSGSQAKEVGFDDNEI